MRRKIAENFILKMKLKKYLKTIKNKQAYEIKENGNKFYLRKGTSDFEVLKDIFGEKTYDFKIIKNPKIILDCGANIGLGSLFFNMRFPEARIIAIEPEETNYELLCKNTENIKNILALKTGLWNKEVNLEIKDIGLGKFGFIVEEVEEGKGIKSESINSLMLKYNIEFIDILKLDIEGSEKEVFEKNNEWLKKVGILVIELHDRMKEGCAKSLFTALMNYDYVFELSGENLIFYFKNYIEE